MVTQEYHVEGPVMIFLTTTAIDLDEELQNRCLTLAVDESAEQTGRIHGCSGNGARWPDSSPGRNAGRVEKAPQRATAVAAGGRAQSVRARLTFATGRTRNRRDHEKYSDAH
jgi:DNA primase